MCDVFGRVEGFQVSGHDCFDEHDWRQGVMQFVDGMRQEDYSVMYRPKLRFSTPARVPGLPFRATDLRCWTPRDGYFAYGDSDRNDDVLLAKSGLRIRVDMVVDGANSSAVLTALEVLAKSRGANAVVIRPHHLVGDGASFHLWTDGRDLHVAAVGVLAWLPDACDLACARANGLLRAA